MLCAIYNAGYSFLRLPFQTCVTQPHMPSLPCSKIAQISNVDLRSSSFNPPNIYCPDSFDFTSSSPITLLQHHSILRRRRSIVELQLAPPSTRYYQLNTNTKLNCTSKSRTHSSSSISLSFCSSSADRLALLSCRHRRRRQPRRRIRPCYTPFVSVRSFKFFSPMSRHSPS